MLILSIVFYDIGHNRDGTFKTTLQNFHIIFFEQRYLCQISGEHLLLSSRGNVVSEF